MMLFIGSMISFALIIAILSPFWLGEGGMLVSASTITDPEKAAKLKKAVLKRYLVDEEAFKGGAISSNEWNQRRQFLTNRYIDLSRRLDFIKNESQGSQPAQAGKEASDA